MKKFFAVTALLVCAFTAAQAQFEIKTNPIALIFEVFPVSLEYNINADWGAEIDALATRGGGFVYFSGKYYLEPRYGADRFNFGMFAGFLGGEGDVGAGIGFLAGYKIVSKKNILLEIALGVGRDFTGDIGVLPYGKFHVGYRFGKKAG